MFVPIVQLVARRPGSVGFDADLVPAALQFIEAKRIEAGGRCRKDLGRRKGSPEHVADEAEHDGEGQGQANGQED